MSRRKRPTQKAAKKLPPKEVTKVTKKRPTNSYSTGIKKLKGEFGDGIRLSSDFLHQTDSFTQVLAKNLSSCARRICVANKKKTITDSEICLAVNLYFPAIMIDGTIDAIETAIAKSKEAKKDNGPQRREVVAGLVFPVSLTEKFLRQFGAFKWNVGNNAPTALTAALEHVMHQIFEISIRKSKEDKKATLCSRHMFLAVYSDEGLRQLIRGFKIEFMAVGVKPFIQPKLLEKKAKKKRPRKKSGGGKKSHKFLPGTVALREIRKYQGGRKDATKLLIQSLPFNRMIRQLAGEMGDGDIHFGSGSLVSIQHFTEQKVTELITTSVGLALHAKREGVKEQDVQMAWNLTCPWVPQTLVEAALDNTDDDEDKPMKGTNGMVRLGRRGGAKRIGRDAFPVIRRFIYSLVSIVLHRTINILKYRKAITVGLADLETAVATLGINFVTLQPAKKSRKKGLKVE